jgi:hypothetical protein
MLYPTPPPAGPGPCIHVPQWEIYPTLLTGIGLTFHRLLRIAELQWNITTPLHAAFYVHY